jgi:two-component system, OmpR family, response regulator
MWILYVEDHLGTAKAVQKLLNQAGHRVEIAPTAADAVAICTAHVFDVWILDLGLPDQHGGNLLKLLRRMYDAKAIAVTGHGSKREIEDGLGDGFDEYIVKPATIDQILAAIERLTAVDAPAPAT